MHCEEARKALLETAENSGTIGLLLWEVNGLLLMCIGVCVYTQKIAHHRS